jgi:hypothetical protein
MIKTLLALTLLSNVTFAADKIFPQTPDAKLTPGSLCDRPKSYRYKERIPYCKRDVSRRAKTEVFAVYRRELGYTLPPKDRHQYKIDHYIPLCAGGSNKMDNLWPQHSSIYKQTDAIEHLGCEKLAQGKVTQKELIRLIKEAKADVSKAGAILKEIKRL